MTEILNVSRRSLLKGAAVSGLVLGFHAGGLRPFASLAMAQAPKRFEPDVFLAIEPNGDVIVTVSRSEMKASGPASPWWWPTSSTPTGRA